MLLLFYSSLTGVKGEIINEIIDPDNLSGENIVI